MQYMIVNNLGKEATEEELARLESHGFKVVTFCVSHGYYYALMRKE